MMACTRGQDTSNVSRALYSIFKIHPLNKTIGKSKSLLAASFVRPARKPDPAVSFVQALHQKYASESTGDKVPAASEIEISGKIVEEVGFEKIRKMLAQVEDLKIVILDGTCIVGPVADGDSPIKEVSPKIVELDLSRNLFETIEPVVEICGELASLRSLRIK